MPRNVKETTDGEETISFIERNYTSIAIILLDICMPKKTGFDVLQYMMEKNLLRSIPVIFITGSDDINTQRQGYGMGVSDIITKPFDSHVVKRRVNNVVDLYKHKNHLESLVFEQSQKLQRNNDMVIEALSSVVEFRDMESGEHIRRIKYFTHSLLNKVAVERPDLTSTVIEQITSASAMHDIGKIAIPDSVLLKPGRLTKDEFEVMKTHTVKGCEILNKLSCLDDTSFFKYCYEICRSHHERWDGKGYPDGLKGDDIPISAQIVAIADVYDALVSERCYKKAYPHQKAIQMIIRGECGQFSPLILRRFREVSDEFYEIARSFR